jgi:hypothetical protein
MVDVADSVGAVVEQVARATEEPVEAVADHLVPTVETAFQRGLLEVAPPPPVAEAGDTPR